jgi:uncharacterized protein (TIGR03435 family)
MRAILFVLLAAAAQAQQPAARAEFEVVSVKAADPSNPGSMGSSLSRVQWRGTSVRNLVLMAYNLNTYQLSGGPKWLESARFDIAAKFPEGAGRDRMPEMMQVMLADRFKLEIHRETRSLPEYALVVAKGGPKLEEASEQDKQQQMSSTGVRKLGGKALALSQLAFMLTNVTGAPVVDRTGILGRYNINLQYAPLLDRKPEDDALPDIFGAVQQLGLKLDAVKGDIEVVVIDKAEMPSEN